MLTAYHDNDERKKFYDEISEILHQERRDQVNAILMRDFKRIVGEGSSNKVTGPFGLGKRNERGKMLINFCRQYDLVVLNIWL